MQDSERRQFLKDEYLHIQKTIVDLDARAISIKTWTVSSSLAAIIAAFVSKNEVVFLLSAFSSLLFYVSEVYWKINQQGFYGRSDRIEQCFSGKIKRLDPFQIDRHWVEFEQQKRRSHLWSVMRKQHVHIPHIPILILSVSLFVMVKTGWLVL